MTNDAAAVDVEIDPQSCRFRHSQTHFALQAIDSEELLVFGLELLNLGGSEKPENRLGLKSRRVTVTGLRVTST